MIEGYIIIGTDESGKTVRYNNNFYLQDAIKSAEIEILNYSSELVKAHIVDGELSLDAPKAKLKDLRLKKIAINIQIIDTGVECIDKDNNYYTFNNNKGDSKYNYIED